MGSRKYEVEEIKMANYSIKSIRRQELLLGITFEKHIKLDSFPMSYLNLSKQEVKNPFFFKIKNLMYFSIIKNVIIIIIHFKPFNDFFH